MSDSWIEDVAKETQHVETPRSWIWWSLVSAISASAANYYLRALKGTVIYKPNLYSILLGESGLGKGFPINLAKLLVQKADITRTVAGRSSIQAIVTELSKQKTRPDGKAPIDDSRGFVINGELSSAIIADVDSLAILTDLYDGHYNDEWMNLLKISGKEKLHNPYIVTLFGSSPAHFYDSIPQANIEGGYIGRNLIIYEEARHQNVDLLESDNDEVDDKLKEYIIPHYSKHLVKINSSKGRLVPEESAKNLFNLWRKDWRAKQQPDKTGFVNRVPDHVLKVSMCLSLSRYTSGGVISEFDMDTAIKAVVNLMYSNRMTTAGRGIDPLAAQGRLVIEILFSCSEYSSSRKELLAAGHGNFDIPTLDRLMDTYLDMNWIKRERIGSGVDSDWKYTLTDKPLQVYGRKKKAKENGQ